MKTETNWESRHLGGGEKSKSILNRILFAAGCVIAVLHGGSKGFYGRITYPYTDAETHYLYDNGSYVTNDAVHVAFIRSPLVPSSAIFWLDACPISVTNADEVAANTFNVYSNLFAEMSVPFDLAYPAATNFNWFGYTDWVPGPVTHTNGVAFIVWRLPTQGTPEQAVNVVPYRTGIYADAARLAPNPALTNGPASVRSGLLSIQEKNP